MQADLTAAIQAAVTELFGEHPAQVELTRPDEQFGDYATNVALQLAKALGKSPREVAETLAVKIRENLSEQITAAEVAGPGFINLRLSDAALLAGLAAAPAQPLAGQTVVAEYSDPNPFKVLHAGHLYTTLVGDAVSRLMEAGGATVHRVNFGGDVGRHVGITMWAVVRDLGGEHPEKLIEVASDQRLIWLSQHYVDGTAAYEDNEQAKAEITELNKRVYQIHASDDHDSPLAQIYWTCRQWSYDGFNALYERLGVAPFDKYYPESAVSDLGLETVREHIGPVYEESDGAVIYRGEPEGLFTQVFINSEGLPTYAAKDVGLIQQKQRDFSPSRSFIFTDVAQKDHLAVVLASVRHFEPELVAATTHYTHGQIKLAGGVKMSSRKGNILRADDILEAVATASKSLRDKDSPAVELGAIKYAFLKNRIGGDIIYDPAESVSLEGNSGPYLQYAHARACSILRKTPDAAASLEGADLTDGERSLVRKIGEFAEVVDRAVSELMPHHVCGYLYELAQIFNRFYEHNRVLGDERQAIRLALVQAYADRLHGGLELLGIAAPDTM